MAAQAPFRLSAAAGAAVASEGLLLLAVAAAPWPYGGAPDAVRFALAAAALLAGALWALSCCLEGRGVSALTLAALALPALAALQIAVGSTVAPGRTRDGMLLLGAFAAALAVLEDRGSSRAGAWRVAAVVMAAATAEAAFAALQSSLGAPRLYGRTSEEVTAPFGSFVNHNHFAAFVEPAVLLAAGLAWGLYRRAGRPTPGMLGLAALALALAAVQLASGSRGGMAALVAGGLTLVALRAVAGRAVGRRARPAMVVLVMASLSALLALALVSPQARARLGSAVEGRADGSRAYRLDTARATLALAAQRPLLGSGFGAYEDALPPFKLRHGDVRTTHAESDVLEMLGEGGLLGALAVAALLVVGCRALAARLRHRKARERRWLALAAAAAAVAVLAHAALDFGLRLPAVALVLAAVGALAAAPVLPRPRGGAVLAAAIALLCVAGAVAAARRALAAHDLSRAASIGDPRLRAAALGGLLDAHPGWSEAHRARALALCAAFDGDASGRRLTRAGQDLEAALQGRPQWSGAWADLAWVREVRGDMAGASAAHERAALLDPASTGIALGRAGFLLRRGERMAARAELVRLKARNPAWTTARVEEAARRLGADAAFLEALREAPPPS